MRWFNFDTWQSRANRWFVFERVLLDGYRWTPVVKIRLRKYKSAQLRVKSDPPTAPVSAGEETK